MSNGHREIVKLLLERGARSNIKDEYKFTPLSWALKKRHTEIVKMLIDHGGKFNV